MIGIIYLLVINSEEDLHLISELYSKYNKELYFVALNILKDSGNAEEAVQEAFIKIIDNLHKIQKIPCPEIIKFCVVIVRNVSIDIYRKKAKLTYVEDVTYFSDDYSTIEENFFKKEKSSIIQESLNKLSVNDRQLIQLRFGKEMSFKEMGSLLDISESLANKRTQRALIKLRKIMV